MDRQTAYSGQVPRTLDLLMAEQNTMVGLAKLAAAVFGAATLVDAFTVTPTTPASLNVLLTPGSIYQIEDLEATTWSSVAADTAHTILKQGILLDPVTFGITPPGTVGFSQAFLVQVQYQDLDTGSLVLPYYNASDPSSPFAGPGDSGTAQNTVRKGAVAAQIKAGAAASTGTQVAPTPDAGWTGLFVITVANGASSITSGNITAYSGAPFLQSNGYLPQIPAGVQNSSWTAFSDTGSADALVIAPLPAPAAWTGGLFFQVKKGANANATTAPTLNLVKADGTLLGTKSIVDRRGQTLAIGDLPANAELLLFYDGNNVRNLGPVSADIGVLGSLRNVQQFTTTTRVSMSGNSGNSYKVTPWSGLSYQKQSATSTLLVWLVIPTLTPNVAAGSALIELNIGSTTVIGNASNSQNGTTVLAIAPNVLNAVIAGLAAGAQSISVDFKRSDTSAWTSIFCPNSSDASYYGANSLATIIVAELGA